MKDYYKEITHALSQHESYHPYPQHTMEWIANRIDWCWKFRKITPSQLNELTNRAITIFERR